MTFNWETERSICWYVDHSEAIAFSLLDIDACADHLRTANKSSYPVYQARVGNLRYDVIQTSLFKLKIFDLEKQELTGSSFPSRKMTSISGAGYEPSKDMSGQNMSEKTEFEQTLWYQSARVITVVSSSTSYRARCGSSGSYLITVNDFSAYTILLEIGLTIDNKCTT